MINKSIEIESLVANNAGRKKTFQVTIANLEKYRGDYKKYIDEVHGYFVSGMKAARKEGTTSYQKEYNELASECKEWLQKYDQAKAVKAETIPFLPFWALWGSITDRAGNAGRLWLLVNTLIVIDTIAALGLLVWTVCLISAQNGIGSIFDTPFFSTAVVLLFVFNILIVALRIWCWAQNVKDYNAGKKTENEGNIKSVEELKDSRLTRLDRWRKNNPNWVDSSGEFRCPANLEVDIPWMTNIMKDAVGKVKSPVNTSLYAKTYEFKFDHASQLRTDGVKDESAQFLAGMDEKIANIKRERDGLDRAAMSEYDKFTQNSAIIDDIGFASAKISSDAGIANKMLEQAQPRLIADHLLVGLRRLLPGKPLPVFIPWQSTEENTPGHIMITCDNDNLNKNNASNLARNLIVRMMATFHPGLVRFSFLDPLKSNEAAIFRDKMPPEMYYREVMSSEQKISGHIELLNAKMDEIQRILPSDCRSLPKFNTQQTSVYQAKPYEVVVIFDFQSIGVNNNRLLPLINNGAKHGVYLLVISSEMLDKNYRYEQMDMQKFIRIKAGGKEYNVSYFDTKGREQKFIFNSMDDTSLLPSFRQPLAINGEISSALDKYFEKTPDALKQWNDKNKVDTGLGKFKNAPFELINNDFSVPIGVSENKPFNFELDQEGNTHTFILGMTGSGKSVLLHDILTAAVLKYSPEDLNLYLMDFKKGGVEFNAYAPENKEDVKNDMEVIPHIKAALLDDCDRQVVVEILRRLSDEMNSRGKLFRNDRKKNLSEYNATAKKRLPTIILAVDECHLLFGVKQDEHQKSINQIVQNIASQGRSQGIHLIFATQTLADSHIPDTIMKNISNRFVLRAAESDANKLGLNNCEVELKKLDKPGAAIYKTGEGQRMVQPDFLDEQELPELMKTVCEKAKKQNLMTREEKFIFRGTWEPSIAETPFKQKENPMTIGISFTLDKEPLAVPIYKKDGGNNLLLIGNREERDGEAESNALRIITISLLSLTEYYKKNGKPCNIFIINRLDTDNEAMNVLKSFAAYPYCQFLDERESVEKIFAALLQRIDSEDRQQPDTFLYILGTQSFRDLKNNRKFKRSVENMQVENNSSDWFSGSTGVSSEISYSDCLEKILDNGAHCGVHIVLQVDKTSNLFLKDSYNAKTLFSYMVLLGMPAADARNLTKIELPTDELPTEKERLKAIFFNDATSKTTTFVPFAVLSKEYIERKIDE